MFLNTFKEIVKMHVIFIKRAMPKNWNDVN